MTILQRPDPLSLSGNIKEFRIGTTTTISFRLLQGGEEIVARSYEPGADGIVIINIRDIIHDRLSFLFSNTSIVYEQTKIVSAFIAQISGTEVEFTAVRCGVDMLAETPSNFLIRNFLTWQPNVKPVTYYSPEFLTYYAVRECQVKLHAYFTDESAVVISQSEITLADLTEGKAYTIPLQYASVAEKLGNKMPAYYDVWVEDVGGERLSYTQRYYASDMKSETEQWVLFENSLGGIDTFRAYGSTAFTGEHTHNIAEIDDVSLEYRVDTARKFQKDTGYLNRKERAWLLDFFPSLKKYLYTGSYIRSIIVVESNVTYTDKELPSNYTFTYKFADAKPFLNLQRTDVPTGALEIVVPEVGSFTVPPRLIEFPRLPLSEGALFPVQDPYSEGWNVTTTGSVSDYIINRISENYGGGGGIGHYHDNIDLLNLLTSAAGYLLIAGKRAKVGYSDEALSFVDDIAKNLIRFSKGLQSDNIATSDYSPGLLGRGGCFKIDPQTGKTVLEVDSANLREELVVPKITFNCIDVISGDKANTFSFGIIKNVDTEKCIAELELLEDEVGTPQVGDIIRGIFHNIEGANVEEDFYDENGFLNYAGFSTAYFTPLDILAHVPGWFKFRYALKAGTTVHPMVGMRFYAYGNFYDKTRQSITYENRYYTRRLKNVNTWVINPSKNIAMQDGLLEGLNIGGMVMHGHGTFMENCYFTGVQIQFTPDQKEEIKGEDAYSVSLSTNESLVVLDDESNLIGGLIEERYVASGENYVISDDDYVTATLARLKTRIQAFRGRQELYYSDEYHEDAYMVILNAVGCKAVVDNGLVAITEISDYEHCYVDIAVNCEGNCVFDKSYKVTAVRNGTSVIYGDIDNEMASVSCDTAGNVLFGLPVRTTVSMWYGNKELPVDKVELILPDGVAGTVDKGAVSITGISKEALNSLNINIKAFATYAGVQYHKQLSLVVNKIIPGENGQNAVLFNLNPSVSALKVDKAGNYDVSSISCGLTKTDGISSVNSTLPEGYVMKYTVDSGNSQVYTLGSNIAVTGIKKKILFQIFKGSTLIDQETIYVINDGIDGEPGKDALSPIFADLDNAVTSVSCTFSGEVEFGLPASTSVNMWYGTEKLELDSIIVSAPNGVVYTADKVGVKVSSIAALTPDVININITAKATYKDFQYARELVFTINKIKRGSDGASPVLYELKPSVSSIKVNKDNQFIPETISCVVSRTIAMNIETLLSLPSGFSIYYSKNDSKILNNYSYGALLNIASFDTSVSFWLKRGEVTVDMETIPILRDGFDGDTGEDGQNGTFLKQIFLQSDSRPAAPVGNVIPTGWSEHHDFGELVILNYEGVFFLEDGARRSPRNPGHSTTHKDKLRFTTSVPNQVISLSVIVSCETSYDCAYIGNVDNEVTTSKFHDKLSGENSVTISQNVLTAGEHYIEIMYSKDGAGSIGKDMVKYKVVNSNTIWVSSAQATYDRDAKTWIYGTWSQPSRYLADTPDVEYIFRREETSFIPESSPNQSKYLPLPFPASEDYRGEFDVTYSQVLKAVYKASNGYYRCVKARPANSMIEISDEEYFEYIIPFTDDPLGVTNEYPVEYMSMRRKQNGKWGAFSLPVPHARKGEPGESGASGSTYRRWKGYTVGQKYRNDDNVTDLLLLEDDGIHYIDVLLLANPAMDTGYDCYIARKFEGRNFWIGTSDIHPLNETFTGNISPHWQRANNMVSIFTDLIIAKNAVLDFMQGNKIQIMNKDGTVNACLGDGYSPLWIGAASSDDAAICFNIDGSGYLAKRNLSWDERGNMFFRGSIFNQLRPFDLVDDAAIVNLDFSTGFDLDISRLTTYMTPCTVLLPSAADYVGAKCTMWFGHFCTRVHHVHPVIAVKDNSRILNVEKNVTSGSSSVYKISPKQLKKLTFSALPFFNYNGEIYEIGWYLDNPEDVEIIG